MKLMKRGYIMLLQLLFFLILYPKNWRKRRRGSTTPECLLIYDLYFLYYFLLQLNEIKLKYDTLEKHVLENRQQSQTKIADFIEDVLLGQWNSLRTNKELLETGTKSHPPVSYWPGLLLRSSIMFRISWT